MAGTPPDTRLPDSVRGHWVERWSPDWFRPFAQLSRLDRPIGWWLLLLPCWWSASLAADSLGRPMPDWWHLVLFLIGAVAMRGAGCTYNDIVDRDLDAGVARTRARPIPSGRVSVAQASAWLVLQALVGLVVLLQFNRATIIVGLASLGLIAIYPFMKRLTDWPQLFLGLAFSWGALVGWTALTGGLALPPFLLYAGGILWTIGYDTIYALQDREDDALIGVRSTARLFGASAPLAISGFFVGATLLFAAAYFEAGVGPLAYVGLGLGTIHLAWQVITLAPADPVNCLARFRSNRDYGLILFVWLIADTVATQNPQIPAMVARL